MAALSPLVGAEASASPLAQPPEPLRDDVGDASAPAVSVVIQAGAIDDRSGATPALDISMRPVPDTSTAVVHMEAPAVLSPAVLTRPADVAARIGVAQPNLFGSIAMPVGSTPEDMKWNRARAFVPGAEAGPWSDVVRRARSIDVPGKLAVVNAWVNHRIAYATPEAQYGVADYWATARESLTSGRGNCTAYAIAKIELLRAVGVQPQDIYLVLVKDLVRRADHAIVAVRVDGRFVILDSGSDAVLSPEAVHDYRPILTYGYGRTWTHGYREEPQLIMASASIPAGGASGSMIR